MILKLVLLEWSGPIHEMVNALIPALLGQGALAALIAAPELNATLAADGLSQHKRVQAAVTIDDGAARAGVRALDGFRLVYETPATAPDDPALPSSPQAASNGRSSSAPLRLMMAWSLTVPWTRLARANGG